MPDGKLGNKRLAVEREIQLFDRLFGAKLHVGAIQRLQTFAESFDQRVVNERLAIENDILRDRKAGNQRKFLMDHADAGFQRIVRAVEIGFLAADVEFALVASRLGDHIHAEQNVHQRRLPRAVLPHQTKDPSLAQAE